MIVLLATLTFGIIEAPSRGWTSPVIVAAFSAAGAALLALLVYEPRREDPLIDLRFFRSIPFASSIVISVAAFAAFGGFLFLNTLYLQEARGLSPVQAGLATVPMALMTVVASPLSGRIVGRRGPRLPLVISGVCLVTACAMLTGLGPATPLAWLLAAYVVFGLGFGFVNAPITNAAVSGMPRAQAGVAVGDRHDLPAGRPDARRRGRRRDRRLPRGRRGGPVLGEPPGLVDAHGLRRRRARARPRGHHRPGAARRPAGRRRRSIRRHSLHRLVARWTHARHAHARSGC